MAEYNTVANNLVAAVRYLCATGATWYKGNLVQSDNAGKARPLNASNSYRVLGVLQRPPTLEAPNDTAVEVIEGDFTFDDSGSDSVAALAIGTAVYAESATVVCATAGSLPKAGTFLGLDAASGKPVVRVTLATTA